MRPPYESAPTAANGRGAMQTIGRGLRGKSSRLPDNWRDRLPDPGVYYGQTIIKLGRVNSSGWAQGKCPFHEDTAASLSVRVADRGNWKCFAGCGGGDLVSFHMQRTGMTFVEAVRDLLGVQP